MVSSSPNSGARTHRDIKCHHSIARTSPVHRVGNAVDFDGLHRRTVERKLKQLVSTANAGGMNDEHLSVWVSERPTCPAGIVVLQEVSGLAAELHGCDAVTVAIRAKK